MTNPFPPIPSQEEIDMWNEEDPGIWQTVREAMLSQPLWKLVLEMIAVLSVIPVAWGIALILVGLGLVSP